MTYGALALACLLGVNAHPLPDQSSVSIGPGVLTYPELASKVSGPGRHVVAASALRNGAAYVYLRHRTWTSVTAALSAGLDLRLTHTRGPGEWLLEQDPAALSRDARRRAMFTSLLHKKVVANASAPERVKPVTPAISEAARVMLELERREETDPEHSQPETARLAERVQEIDETADPDAWLADTLDRSSSDAEVLQAIAHTQPFRAVDPRNIFDVPGLVQIMDEFARSTNGRPPALKSLSTELRDTIGHIVRGNVYFGYRMQFHPTSLVLGPQVLSGLGSDLSLDSRPESGLEATSTEALLDAVDPDAPRAAHTARTEAEAFFRTPAGQRMFDVNRAQHTTSLSQAVEAWSREGDAEALMELSPIREVLTGLPDRDTTNPESGESRPAIHRTSLAALHSTAGYPFDAWEYRDVDGVLCVRNGLAFLDRARVFPLPALLRLQGVSKLMDSGGALRSYAALPDILVFHRAINAEQNGNLSWLGTYRGTNVADLTDARPLLLMLGAFSLEGRSRLTNLIRTGGTLRLALSDIPSELVDALGRNLGENTLYCQSPASVALISEGCLMPGLPQMVRSWIAVVSVQNGPAERTREVTLALERPSKQPDAEPQTVTEVHLIVTQP